MIKSKQFRLRIITKIIDPKGKVVKEQRFEAKSFLKNWSEWVRGLWNDALVTMIDTGGASRTLWPVYYSTAEYTADFRSNADAEDDTFGIFVGTGTKVPEPQDYNLEAKIPHGTATGQLSYGATSVGTVAVDAYESAFRVERVYTNYSGADITVSEVGLANKCYTKKAGVWNTWYFLLIRDLLPTPDTIPDGYSYMVSYEILHKAYG